MQISQKSYSKIQIQIRGFQLGLIFNFKELHDHSKRSRGKIRKPIYGFISLFHVLGNWKPTLLALLYQLRKEEQKGKVFKSGPFIEP